MAAPHVIIPEREASAGRKTRRFSLTGRRGSTAGRASVRRDSLMATLSSLGGNRRNSLAPLKMRDVVLMDKFEDVKEAALAEHATERSWKSAIKKVKAQNPKAPLALTKSVTETARDESYRRGSIATAEDLEDLREVSCEVDETTPTAAAALTPTPTEPSDWDVAASILATALRSAGSTPPSPQATAQETLERIAAVCEPAVFTAHRPVGRALHESDDNSAKRHKAQKDPRAAPIMPRSEVESEVIFGRRLNATRSLVDLRSGPQRVLVLAQQPHETAAQASARLEVAGTCPAIVMPIGADEDEESFAERLESLRATPRPAHNGAPRCAPVLARGKHETSASFTLRLEVAVYCSVVVPPQASGESESDVVCRLNAQKESLHTWIDAYRPHTETRDAFLQRCTAGKQPSALGKRPSSERVSVTTPQRVQLQVAERVGRSPQRIRRAATTGGSTRAASSGPATSTGSTSARSSGGGAITSSPHRHHSRHGALSSFGKSMRTFMMGHRMRKAHSVAAAERKHGRRVSF